MVFIRKKRRKSLLFSIITLFLLLAVFTFSLAGFERSKSIQQNAILSIQGEQFRYLEDDIVSGIYSDLLEINLSNISRRAGEVIINFTYGGTLSPAKNHAALMNNYSSFIEETYAKLYNMNIKLMNFNPSFTIDPMNVTFSIQQDALDIFNPNYADIQYLRIVVEVNDTQSNEMLNSSPTTSGGIDVEVYLIDSGGKGLLQDTFASLSATKVNPPFRAQFINGGKIEVEFGKVINTDGRLQIRVNNLMAKVKSLEITYDLPEDNVAILSGANLTLNASGLIKNSEIILAEE